MKNLHEQIELQALFQNVPISCLVMSELSSIYVLGGE